MTWRDVALALCIDLNLFACGKRWRRRSSTRPESNVSSWRPLDITGLVRERETYMSGSGGGGGGSSSSSDNDSGSRGSDDWDCGGQVSGQRRTELRTCHRPPLPLATWSRDYNCAASCSNLAAVTAVTSLYSTRATKNRLIILAKRNKDP